MKANFCISIAFASALATLPLAHAEPAPFTWEEVRKLAREQNPALASALLSHQASKEAVKGAYGAFLPKVVLNADRTRSTTELVTSATESTKTDIHYGATASLNIFKGLSSRASLGKAKAAEQGAEAGIRLTSTDLRHDLRAAFFSIYVQQETLRLNEKALKRQQQNQKLVELKYGTGSEARWNVRKTKAELDRAFYNVTGTKTKLANARESLATLLQINQLPDRPVEAPSKNIFDAPNVNVESAVNTHPELLKSRFATESAAQDRLIARSGFYPSIDLSYSRSHTTSQPDAGASTRTNSNAFAISADWNIFNGATDLFKVQEANATHEAALLTQESVQRKLTSSARTKVNSYRSFLEQLPVNKAVREAAEEREKTVSAQYRAGLKNYLDWEQAETQLLDAEQAEVRGLSDTLTAFADMEQALGLSLEQE